jgi:amino acid transporter
MESAAIPAGTPEDAPSAGTGEGGLKAGAIGYASNLIISVASVAPAYSLASILGFVVAVKGMGVHAPAVMIVSFIPMLLIAAAYYYMNRADPDCGTSFTWVTRAMGPQLGWLTGWAIIVCDIIVMATLAYIAGVYTFLLFGLDAAASNTLDVSIIAAIWIVSMTWICVIGIELNASTQKFLLMIEVFTLAAFSIVALLKVYGVIGTVPANSMHVAGSWFSPFGLPGGSTALINGVLLGVFIYWGWDSGVCVNEESDDPSSGPGKAAVVSTFLLLGIYLIVAVAAQAFHGTGFLENNSDDVLKALATDVFPSPFDKLLIITVLTSASASTQTTILPTARTALSMARIGSIPKALGRIHPRYLTPDVATIAMGAISLAWTLFIINVSQNVLADAITGIGFQIAFYYGLTGFACAIFYRRELMKSFRNFFMAGVVPTVGGLMLAYIFVKAFSDYNTTSTEVNYTGGLWGIGTPILIGVGGLVLGVVVLVFANFAYKPFFRRKSEVARPGILEGEVTGQATVMADPE